MANILLVCRPELNNFMGDITRHWRGQNHNLIYPVKDVSREAMLNADIIWIEWANEEAVFLTQRCSNLLEGKKVIIRLHSYEYFSGYVNHINWKYVTDLVFVSPTVRELVEKNWPLGAKKPRMHTILNGIDVEKYEFQENKVCGNKIAFLGYINYKKGPMLLLHAFNDLVYKSYDDYSLYIGGTFQDERDKLYFERFRKNSFAGEYMYLDGWIKDVNKWFQDKSFIISTSLFEGCPVGLLEGMACGCRPLIHNFPGADKLYPEEFRWLTISQMREMVCNKNEDYNPVQYRQFVAYNFPLSRQLEQIDEVLK